MRWGPTWLQPKRFRLAGCLGLRMSRLAKATACSCSTPACNEEAYLELVPGPPLGLAPGKSKKSRQAGAADRSKADRRMACCYFKERPAAKTFQHICGQEPCGCKGILREQFSCKGGGCCGHEFHSSGRSRGSRPTGRAGNQGRCAEDPCPLPTCHANSQKMVWLWCKQGPMFGAT